MEYLHSPMNVKDKPSKSEYKERNEFEYQLDGLRAGFYQDKDYDGFELESYVDMESINQPG